MNSFLVSFILIAICFVLFVKSLWVWHIHIARKKGIYPPSGKATLFDVRRLLLIGEKALAIRVYQEIYRVRLKEAQRAVDDIADSINQKHS